MLNGYIMAYILMVNSCYIKCLTGLQKERHCHTGTIYILIYTILSLISLGQSYISIYIFTLPYIYRHHIVDIHNVTTGNISHVNNSYIVIHNTGWIIIIPIVVGMNTSQYHFHYSYYCHYIHTWDIIISKFVFVIKYRMLMEEVG